MNTCSCCMLLDYEGVAPFLDGPHISPTCPTVQSNFKKKLSIECWRNDNDTLKTM